jgi:signal transduction histidine kinase
MTLRTRLTLWYAVILCLSLLLIGVGAYRELVERFEGRHPERPSRHALQEAGEIIVQEGLPALALALIGGWWLTRRAMGPVAALTQAAERVNESSLSIQLPRSGNGDELDRLTDVFNAMTRRLNDSFSHIREFTLHASHELKTPLTVLCGEAEMAAGDETLTSADRERWASQLDELRRLSRIVDALTLLAKADAGQLALAQDPVPLDELLRDNFADAQILGEPHNIKVELGTCPPSIVVGDRDRLRQMLLNLVDNAIKYNNPGGWVSMALSQDTDSAKLIITNTGPGIPIQSLPRIFDRFYRGDLAHSDRVEGSGLGLSIAKWIVSAHKGEIRIDSVPEKLTTVTVSLPLLPGTPRV